MRELSNAGSLLNVATQTMRDEIVQHLPEEAKYSGLMVIRAMQLATRYVEATTLSEPFSSKDNGLEVLVQKIYVPILGMVNSTKKAPSATPAWLRSL